MAELANLVENRPPEALKRRLDLEKTGEEAARFDFEATTCKVLISLREDYLPDFEGLRLIMRSIMQNRLRVTRMTAAQALAVVRKPGGELLEVGVAEAVVQFVAASGAGPEAEGGADPPTDHLEVEPSLLSLVCRELNNKRLGRRLPKITADLLAGSRREILADFYERCTADVSPEVRRFIEDRLLTRSGFRDSVALESALAEPGISQEVVDRLVGRRLLRLEERFDRRRVELTHDLLVEPIRLSRDSYHHRTALAEAADREKQVREKLAQTRRRAARYGAASLLVIVLFGVGAYYWRCLSVVADKGRREAEAQRLQAEESRYAANMRLAQQAADEGNLGRTVYLLRQYVPRPGDPDLRGFEWRHLAWVCFGDSRATYRGCSDEVRSVAFSPDGAVLAVGAADSTVRLLDPIGRQEVFRWKLPGPGVMAVAFSPDGKVLAAATGNWRRSGTAGGVYLLDPRTCAVISVLKGHGKSVNTLAFSPDGALLAAGSEDDTIRVWKRVDGSYQPLFTFAGHTGGVNAVAFTPDGLRLAGGWGDGNLKVWDVQAGKVLMDAVVQVSGVMSLAYAPGGNSLVVGSRDGPVLFYDSESFKLASTLDVRQGIVFSMSFSADGTMLATGGSNGTVKLWRTADMHPVAKLKGHRDMVYALAFAHDGKLLASGSGDRTVKIWDVPAPPDRFRPRMDGAVSSLAFRPDGKTMAAGQGETADSAAPDRGEVYVWPVAGDGPPVVLAGHKDIVCAVAFSPDGATLASGSRDNTVILWDLAARKKLRVLEGHTALVTSVRFSPDGKLLASGSRDGLIKLWDVTGDAASPPTTLSGHKGWVRSVAFSPDGTRLASASSDRGVYLWDVAARARPGLLRRVPRGLQRGRVLARRRPAGGGQHGSNRPPVGTVRRPAGFRRAGHPARL